MRVLHVTSPLMRGADVRWAQKRLKNSRFGDFHPGTIDGQFGRQSGSASSRAKFWLGFPKRSLRLRLRYESHVYGPELNSYLSGMRLPLRYRARRAYRLRHRFPLRERAFKLAVSQIGVKEYPAGSNRCKFSNWYGICGPWCAMFVTWCYVGAGSKKFVRGSRYAYCPYLQYAIKHGWYGFRELSRSAVQRGDIVLYDWERDGVPNHVGLFDSWIDRAHGTFYAVEGNTAVGNDSNGGAVMRRVRSAYQVSCFGRQES